MVLPGVVVLTVETTSPGGPVVYFNVTIREEGSAEVKTEKFTITDYNPNEGAVLTVDVPTGGSFSFVVLSFNSFGFLGEVDDANVTVIPQGNLFLENRYTLSSCCCITASFKLMFEILNG